MARIGHSGRDINLIPYIGGKYALISNIVPIIEYGALAHGLTHYYEICGGGAKMLLNLPVTLFEQRSYNDVDLGLCRLFACLGNRNHLYALMERLEELGISEEIFMAARHAVEHESRMVKAGRLEAELDLVTAASYTFLLATLSRAADMVKYDGTRISNPVRRAGYARKVSRLDQFYPILCDIEVTHGDCLELLDMLRSREDVFIYADPPYTPEQMVLQDHYGENSWSNADHDRLVDKLLVTKAKVALSGYDNMRYERLVRAGWYKLFLKNVHVSSAATGRRNDEYLWLNFPIPSSLVEQVSNRDYGDFS